MSKIDSRWLDYISFGDRLDQAISFAVLNRKINIQSKEFNHQNGLLQVIEIIEDKFDDASGLILDAPSPVFILSSLMQYTLDYLGIKRSLENQNNQIQKIYKKTDFLIEEAIKNMSIDKYQESKLCVTSILGLYQYNSEIEEISEVIEIEEELISTRGQYIYLQKLHKKRRAPWVIVLLGTIIGTIIIVSVIDSINVPINEIYALPIVLLLFLGYWGIIKSYPNELRALESERANLKRKLPSKENIDYLVKKYGRKKEKEYQITKQQHLDWIDNIITKNQSGFVLEPVLFSINRIRKS